MYLNFLKHEELVTKKKIEFLRWEKEAHKPELGWNEGGEGYAKKRC